MATGVFDNIAQLKEATGGFRLSTSKPGANQPTHQGKILEVFQSGERGLARRESKSLERALHENAIAVGSTEVAKYGRVGPEWIPKATRKRAIIVDIYGANGTGKSTLAEAIRRECTEQGLRDPLLLRESKLARRVHRELHDRLEGATDREESDADIQNYTWLQMIGDTRLEALRVTPSGERAEFGERVVDYFSEPIVALYVHGIGSTLAHGLVEGAMDPRFALGRLRGTYRRPDVSLILTVDQETALERIRERETRRVQELDSVSARELQKKLDKVRQKFPDMDRAYAILKRGLPNGVRLDTTNHPAEEMARKFVERLMSSYISHQPGAHDYLRT